jgi:hypothetical protein
MNSSAIKTFTLICIVTVGIQSCSVNPYKYLKNYEGGIEPYSLNLKMGTELFILREDIYRETNSVESASITAVNGTETVDVTYHPMGFHICKGVFLDLNENLTFNIAELFDVETKDHYQILEETPSLFSTQKYIIKKNGNEILRVSEGLLGNCIDKITIEADQISIDECGALSSKQTITTSPDKMMFEYQLINWFPPTITKENDNCYKIKNGFGSDKIEQIENNQISFKKYLKINRLEDRIEFNYYFLGHPIYLIQLDDGFIFQNSSNQLVKIKTSKDKIEVFRDDKLRKTYTLTNIQN